MKSIKCILLISTCCLLPNVGQAEINLTFDVSNTSLSNPTLHTHHTPVELKPISSLDGAKFAAACFLPKCDDSQDYVNLDKNKQCEDEGFIKTCPNGEKIKVGNRCPHNDNYGTCCKENCPENSSTTCSGSIIGNDGCGYNCYQCDPCPGYHPCGGTWQYCTGSKCSQDTTRCSNYCVDDYFNNKCDNQADCQGIYRNGYCSGSCIKSADADCPSGYSTFITTCSEGYYLDSNGYSNETRCNRCTPKPCPEGYSTTASCPSGQLLTSGLSGNQTCKKCCNNSCPENSSIRECNSVYFTETISNECGNTCNLCYAQVTSVININSKNFGPMRVDNGTATYWVCLYDMKCTYANGDMAKGYTTSIILGNVVETPEKPNIDCKQLLPDDSVIGKALNNGKYLDNDGIVSGVHGCRL